MGRISKDKFKKILTQYPNYDSIKIFIETGLWDGTQNKYATDANVFDTIYGIELNEHWATVTQKKCPNSIIIHGDTKDELPKVLDKHPMDPIFIYLDAHFCHTQPPIKKSEYPLWDELDVINKRNQADIVVIDDVHNFGKVRNDLKLDKSVKEWELVTEENILNVFGDRVVGSLFLGDAFVIWLK
jgi:hypothetical protein